MSKIVWDAIGEHLYETGVDHGVLYTFNPNAAAGQTPYDSGVAWNGLTSVNENPSGADSNKQYADNIEYLNLIGLEEFGATIEAFTYPEEFEACDGSVEVAPGVYAGQQNRQTFGFSYRTLIGNDTLGTEKGYKIHLVYGAKAAPSGKDRQTVNENPEAVAFSWEITTTPVPLSGHKPIAHMVIDSTKVDADKLEDFLDILYGTDASGGSTATTPSLPLPDKVVELLTPATHP